MEITILRFHSPLTTPIQHVLASRCPPLLYCPLQEDLEVSPVEGYLPIIDWSDGEELAQAEL